MEPFVVLFAAALLVVAYRRQRAEFRARQIAEGVAVEAELGAEGGAR